jgi:hypothetical protein
LIDLLPQKIKQNFFNSGREKRSMQVKKIEFLIEETDKKMMVGDL